MERVGQKLSISHWRVFSTYGNIRRYTIAPFPLFVCTGSAPTLSSQGYILPPNPIQNNSLHFSNIPNKILPLLMWRLSTKKVNTCILCKTLEHIDTSSITKHLHVSKLNIFYELQHGFREKSSCESQLLMLVDDLFKSLYKK